jgi:hypothetical protein
MLGPAKRSPSTRKIHDLDERIKRLAKFEDWAKCEAVAIEALVNPQDWQKYYALQGEILSKMRDAQILAARISEQINSSLAKLESN